jgi:hypothetical protein
MKDNGVRSAVETDTRINDRSELHRQVDDIVHSATVIDVHTHLFSPEFGALNLYGIDELLTYHYLIAETFRFASVTPERFWKMPKSEQADLVWKSLFVDNSPVSEATRGVITVLTAFGLDPTAADLREAREFFASRNIREHVSRVLEMASVGSVVMTNDIFDAAEMAVWKQTTEVDPRFRSSLRMDRLVNHWKYTSPRLAQQGLTVDAELTSKTSTALRRYLDECIERLKPDYLAVSLPDNFQFPAGDERDQIIREVVFPTAREHRLPIALMVGVRRGVNPALKAAGDGVGRADVGAIERMCVENPDVRFLATFLSRENQHELCVAARKFSNLMPFGCWWFLNNPSIIEEITTERLELLGTSFIPQHSDARVLEQLIYKWQHSRTVIADCLSNSYEQLLSAGRPVTRGEIERDVKRMFSGNFSEWVCARSS